MTRPVKLSDVPLSVRRKIKTKVMRGESVSGREKARRESERARRKAEAESIQAAFRLLCRTNGLPIPATEYHFSPPRRWRFDYAFVEEKLALEVEGGVWTRGRHTRGSGFLKDCEKYNAATCLGWRLLRVVPTTLQTPETIALIQRAMRAEAAA